MHRLTLPTKRYFRMLLFTRFNSRSQNRWCQLATLHRKEKKTFSSLIHMTWQGKEEMHKSLLWCYKYRLDWLSCQKTFFTWTRGKINCYKHSAWKIFSHIILTFLTELRHEEKQRVKFGKRFTGQAVKYFLSTACWRCTYCRSLMLRTGTFFATFLPSLIFLEQCQLSTWFGNDS